MMGTGRSRYVVDVARIDRNCSLVADAFSSRGVPLLPAYSVKTNHVPHIVRRFHENGFLAEVVSDMEVAIAEFSGIPLSDVVVNGPAKGRRSADVMAAGGIVVFDSVHDMESFESFSDVRGRCMFRVAANIGNDVMTRFGTRPPEVRESVERAMSDGFDVIGIHCHVTHGRDLASWERKLDVMAGVYSDVHRLLSENVVDMGGNMASPIPYEMRSSFPGSPSFDDYAGLFASRIPGFPRVRFVLEMGTSVVSDCVSYEAQVIDVKRTDGGDVVVLDTSHWALGWASQSMNHPVSIVEAGDGVPVHVDGARLVGVMCTEDDVFHRGFSGDVRIGDVLRFDQVGSYTIVVKPPFIVPQDPVVMLMPDGSQVIAKRRESPNDVLSTYDRGTIEDVLTSKRMDNRL